MLVVALTGLLIGMRHALEADHVAAVAALATGSRTTSQTIRLGIAWGVGHALTIFAIGALLLHLDSFVPEHIAVALEAVVGAMLIVLGGAVLRRMIRDRVHFHVHRHNRLTHFHAHSHRGEGDHAGSRHSHEHPNALTWRAFVVGTVHGLAGTAALVLLTAGSIGSVGFGIAYLALFGLGSIVGMAAMSAAISVPLRLTSDRLTWAYTGLTTVVGFITVGIGAESLYRQAALILTTW